MATDNLTNDGNIKVLWLSPNLNHYKARLLNHLARTQKVDLTVLAGSGRNNKGDGSLTRNWDFELIQTDVPKHRFGFTREVFNFLWNKRNAFDWILIPKETKNSPLILFTWIVCRLTFWRQSRTRLITYNHPIYLEGERKATWLERVNDFILYRLYDRVVFYTQQARDRMVLEGFIPPSKAYYANNTIDTNEVTEFLTSDYPNQSEPTLLFIGRLIPSKKLDVAINYYLNLKERVAGLKLIVIGDGPDSAAIRELANKDPDVTWTGTLVEESAISGYMAKAWLVMVPGASGLSINHAFAYGRPYATSKRAKHGPEMAYLRHEVNGFILNENEQDVMALLSSFLTNFESRYFDSAKQTGAQLSIANWSVQFMKVFGH